MPRFPRKEADFFTFTRVAVPYLTNNATRFGIGTPRQTALNTALTSYSNAYSRSSDRTNRTKADVMNRDNSRKALEDVMNLAYGDIPANVLTDTDRSVLNLPLRSAPTPAPVPTTSPIANVSTASRLQHTISFVDEDPANGRAKPKGVRGCEIWYFIGGTAAPTDIRQYRFMALDTESPYIASFDGTDAGKPVWYMLRWVNTRGQAGPWSAVVMATIAG